MEFTAYRPWSDERKAWTRLRWYRMKSRAFFTAEQRSCAEGDLAAGQWCFSGKVLHVVCECGERLTNPAMDCAGYIHHSCGRSFICGTTDGESKIVRKKAQR